jgi:hypothetical protein
MNPWKEKKQPLGLGGLEELEALRVPRLSIYENVNTEAPVRQN